jgi:4-alpha-glucanotransferase
VTDRELIGRAAAAGISASYENWRHEQVAVPEITLRAILAALEAPPSRASAPVSAAATGASAAAGGPSGLALPASRSWGLAVQLYSVRSRQSWGHGDLHDLAELARWSASQYGAGFILVNPLHAAEPQAPISASPYLPMTRRFTSPLYLRIEDIPEYRQLSAEHRDEIEQLAWPLRARSSTAALIDRDRVWQAKQAALELMFAVEPSPDRQEAFARFKAEQGSELGLWASWCALAEEHGPNWREWPASYRVPQQVPGQRAEFHAWLQWLVDEQLAAAQRAAIEAGMAHGIIHDLAVGVNPAGADAWAHQDLLVSGMRVGAPPDGFNQLGQDWAQPPWHPMRLAEAGYQPLADLFGAGFRHAGGLRVDHVMGLTRLWWVPAGLTPDQGAYVSYDHVAAVAALTGAAANSGGVAIGEDLGTVEPWIRDYLASHQVLGTTMLWWATGPDDMPLPPARWRRACMATVGTHDVPTVAGFLTGDHVRVRAELGLLKTSAQRERQAAKQMLARWQDALRAERLLPAGPPDPPDLTVALYRYLARTPCLLTAVSLADAVGEIRSQNIPGTSEEYPNWQVPLCDADGDPVLLEQLAGLPLADAVCRAASGQQVRFASDS